MVLTARAKVLSLLVGVLALTISACDTFMDTTSVSDLETEVFQVKATLEQMGQAGTQIAELQLTADNSLVLESERNSAEATAFAAQATLTSMNRAASFADERSGARARSPTDTRTSASADGRRSGRHDFLGYNHGDGVATRMVARWIRPLC